MTFPLGDDIDNFEISDDDDDRGDNDNDNE